LRATGSQPHGPGWQKRIRLSSALLPRHARRPKSPEALIPILYLKGISTGDFAEALAALLRPDAGSLIECGDVEFCFEQRDQDVHRLLNEDKNLI
jgi:hypothetical protein